MMPAKTFQPIKHLGFKNLVVGGCSFTHNVSDEHIVTWPYYLRDFGAFDKVIDCSMPGAGNCHIANSVMWTLENQKLDSSSTLAIIMWSGFNRDDCIIDSAHKNNYPFEFDYTNTVSTGMSGGITQDCFGNTKNNAFKSMQAVKSSDSRAIENFLYITSLYNYIQNKNIKFLFLDHLDHKLPNRGGEFDPMDFIPHHLQKNYNQMFTQDIENIYKFSLENDLLSEDDYHPSPDGHMQWTKQHLMPYLNDLVDKSISNTPQF